MKSDRREFLKSLGYLSLAFSLNQCGRSKKRETPNIVFIMIDDLGYGDIGCYGSRLNKTPHIDSLAEKGMLFTDYHSNGPMCTPTRAALMTGQYQHRLGEKFENPLSAKKDPDKYVSENPPSE